MFPFYNPLKTSSNHTFSDVITGHRKESFVWYRLILTLKMFCINWLFTRSLITAESCCRILIVDFNSFVTESLSYRNQFIDLRSKSMDWFLMIGSSATKELNSYLNIELLPMKANISPDWIFPYIHTHVCTQTHIHFWVKMPLRRKGLGLRLKS